MVQTKGCSQTRPAFDVLYIQIKLPIRLHQWFSNFSARWSPIKAYNFLQTLWPSPQGLQKTVTNTRIVCVKINVSTFYFKCMIKYYTTRNMLRTYGPFSDSHSTLWLFIDPLDGPIDPWKSISTTLRTTGLGLATVRKGFENRSHAEPDIQL